MKRVGAGAARFLARREDDLLALLFSGPYLAIALGAFGHPTGARWLLLVPAAPALALAVLAAVRSGDPWGRWGLVGLAVAGLLGLAPALATRWCALAALVPPAPASWVPAGVLVLAAGGLLTAGRAVEAPPRPLLRGVAWMAAGGVTLYVADLAFRFLGTC